MTASQRAKAAQPKLKWRPREQVTAMVLATGVSLTYVLVSSHVYGLPLPTSAFWWLFGVSTAIAIALAWWSKWWDVMLSFFIKMADDGDDLDTTPPAPLLTASSDRRLTNEHNLGRFAAVLYACAMIAHLGWVTVFTGGCFYSPFSQLLLGCALLAPYVANGVKSGIAMGLVSLLSYAIFGYAFDIRSLADSVPGHLIFLTTALATLISLGTINLRQFGKLIRGAISSA